MPLYKNLPHEKKKVAELPFYRPIDRLFLVIWEKRRRLFPLLIAAVLLSLLYGGLRWYGAWAAVKARTAAIDAFRSGQKALQEKRYDEAIRLYQGVAGKQSLPPLFRVAAMQYLAWARLQKGEKDQAIDLLEKVIRDTENVTVDYSRLLLARVYEEKGEKEKARQIYKTLAEGAAAAGSVYGVIQEEAKERLGQEEKNLEKKKSKKGKK